MNNLNQISQKHITLQKKLYEEIEPLVNMAKKLFGRRIMFAPIASMMSAQEYRFHNEDYDESFGNIMDETQLLFNNIVLHKLTMNESKHQSYDVCIFAQTSTGSIVMTTINAEYRTTLTLSAAIDVLIDVNEYERKTFDHIQIDVLNRVCPQSLSLYSQIAKIIGDSAEYDTFNMEEDAEEAMSMYLYSKKVRPGEPNTDDERQQRAVFAAALRDIPFSAFLSVRFHIMRFTFLGINYEIYPVNDSDVYALDHGMHTEILHIEDLQERVHTLLNSCEGVVSLTQLVNPDIDERIQDIMQIRSHAQTLGFETDFKDFELTMYGEYVPISMISKNPKNPDLIVHAITTVEYNENTIATIYLEYTPDATFHYVDETCDTYTNSVQSICDMLTERKQYQNIE